MDRFFTFLNDFKKHHERAKYAAVSVFAFSLFSLIVYFLSDISGTYEKFQSEAMNGPDQEMWEDYFSVKVKKNGSLTDALTKAGVDRNDAKSAAESVNQIINTNNMPAGQEVMFSLSSQEKSQEIKLASLKIIEPQREIEVTRDDSGSFITKEKQVKSHKKMLRAGGVIHNSIYQTGVELGVSAALMLEVIKAYSYDVDFQRDIQSGDSFEILYETYVDGRNKKVKDGNIIYASLEVRGEQIKIYRHANKKDEVDYYNEDGKSIRKALLRTPINGARISSRFGMRMHPVLGYSKMHKGIDFAAPKGTPIYAAGNGTIDFKGWKGGYGNFIQIRHGGDYSTAYGHISRFAAGINRGTRVKQGQVIAYVGSTGRSTGPHLHYETHYRNTQVNPMKIKNMPGTKLAGASLAAFKKRKKEIEYMLASLPLNSGATAAIETSNQETKKIR